MDPENYLLAEIMAQLLENNGITVERKFGFGGTLICYNALREGEIDLYPEYTGTISAVIFDPDEIPEDSISIDSYNIGLNKRDLSIFARFGFNNSYALALKKTVSDQRNIIKISDLKFHPELVLSFSHEFLNRGDGWEALKSVYDLTQSATGIQHGLAYKAIDEGAIDITDAYTTDGDVERYGLVFLEDDLDFFPKYYGAALTRMEFSPQAREILSQLENMLSDEQMRALNAQVVIEQKSFAEVAQQFLYERGLTSGKQAQTSDTVISSLLDNTVTHIKLTLTALGIGCIIGLSLALLIFRSQKLSRYVFFPLALPNILAGIRTATVICIGTATLAAFIGAGGLGEPIVTGLALNDTNLILQGAIPAACLAIFVEVMFELLEKKIIPDHLRNAG